MPGFYIEKQNISDHKIHVSGDEARHILKVLRLKQGEDINLFDAEGTAYECIITSLSKHELIADIRHIRKKTVSTESSFILAQSILKSKKMAGVIQKCTELGVSKIIPFISARTIPKFDERSANKKSGHWDKIITASVKQSGIRKIPVMNRVTSFKKFLAEEYNAHKIILYENEKNISFKDILKKISFPARVMIVVGPEGGFTADEISLAVKNGFTPAGLGDLILRAETVPITAFSILQYEAGNLEPLNHLQKK